MNLFTSFKPLDVEGYKIIFGAELASFKEMDSAGKLAKLNAFSEQSKQLEQKSFAIKSKALKAISAAGVASLTILGTAIVFKVSLVFAAPLAALALSVGLVAWRFLNAQAYSCKQVADLRIELQSKCKENEAKLGQQSQNLQDEKHAKPLISLKIHAETQEYTVPPNQKFYFDFDDIKNIEYSTDNWTTAQTIEENELIAKYLFPVTLKRGDRIEFKIQLTNGTWLAYRPFVISVPM